MKSGCVVAAWLPAGGWSRVVQRLLEAGSGVAVHWGESTDWTEACGCLGFGFGSDDRLNGRPVEHSVLARARVRALSVVSLLGIGFPTSRRVVVEWIW